MEIRLPNKSTLWKSNCAQPREAMAWWPVAARLGTPLLRQITRHKPCSTSNLWFSLGSSPHRAWRTGETDLRPLSGMAGSQGSGEGMGIVELTTAGYEARRRVWGQISDKKIADLARRIELLGIKQADLEEDFIRGSGRGGQKMNKTSSKVRITHLPTGTQVAVQKERERSKNRFLAMRALVERLEEAQGGGKQRAERDRARKAKARSRKRHAALASSDPSDDAVVESDELLDTAEKSATDVLPHEGADERECSPVVAARPPDG